MSMFNKPRPKGWKTPAKPKRKPKPVSEPRYSRYGYSRTTYSERELMKELAPPPVKRGEYLYANCVVLAAAIIGPHSKQWAEDLLPQARMLDWRRTQ